MAKQKTKIVVFHQVAQSEWRNGKGERLQDYTNSETILALVNSPYRCFVRIYDETFSWEVRKGHYDVRLIITKYGR